jgi:hypothetical protein
MSLRTADAFQLTAKSHRPEATPAHSLY